MPDKDYLALGKKNIKPAADVVKYKTILVYARNKKGKTTFSASGERGKVLILDPEEGGVHLKTANPDLWAISTWTDLDEARGYLERALKAQPGLYTWVGLDGLSRFYDMALDYVVKNRDREQDMTVKPGMLTKKDWGQANKIMKAMMLSFCALPINVVMTAQERVFENKAREADEDVSEEDTSYVADLPAGCRGAAYALADVIGRLYVATVEDREGNERKERRLWLGDNPKYDTGGRSDVELPDYLRRPTIPRLLKLL